MIIDTLTIAGFTSAASFLLMPILMKKEFIRVETSDEPQALPTRPLRGDQVDNKGSLAAGSISPA